MKGRHAKLAGEIDSAAGAVQQAKKIAAALAASAFVQGDQLMELTANVSKLRQLIGNDVPDLAKLQRRIDRIMELRNIQELQSFQLEVDRVMQSAWEALP